MSQATQFLPGSGSTPELKENRTRAGQVNVPDEKWNAQRDLGERDRILRDLNLIEKKFAAADQSLPSDLKSAMKEVGLAKNEVQLRKAYQNMQKSLVNFLNSQYDEKQVDWSKSDLKSTFLNYKFKWQDFKDATGTICDDQGHYNITRMIPKIKIPAKPVTQAPNVPAPVTLDELPPQETITPSSSVPVATRVSIGVVDETICTTGVQKVAPTASSNGGGVLGNSRTRTRAVGGICPPCLPTPDGGG